VEPSDEAQRTYTLTYTPFNHPLTPQYHRPAVTTEHEDRASLVRELEAHGVPAHKPWIFTEGTYEYAQDVWTWAEVTEEQEEITSANPYERSLTLAEIEGVLLAQEDMGSDLLPDSKVLADIRALINKLPASSRALQAKHEAPGVTA